MPDLLCLGIESSCDETALALVRGGRLLAQTLASQADLHAIFGGVVPELASREHLRHIGPLFDELLVRSGCNAGDIDVIAVARGPGLLGSLLTGVAFAKGLALATGAPLIGVNHLHAHLLAAGLAAVIPFPCLGLVISGGHADLYIVRSPWDMEKIGRALDDAAGEAFDKVGAAIGLRYPAGRAVNELACAAEKPFAALPRPYLHNGNLDFSFSGLKTAAVQLAKGAGIHVSGGGGEKLGQFCLALNEAVADTLAEKTRRALEMNPDINALCVAGGVAANSIIRDKLSGLMAERGGAFLAPELKYCTDNAAMIAYAGYLLAEEGFRHGLDMEAVPRGRPVPCDWHRALA